VPSNGSPHFGGDPDQDPDPGIFTLREKDNLTNFAGSVALAEVCDLRVLLDIEVFQYPKSTHCIIQ